MRQFFLFTLLLSLAILPGCNRGTPSADDLEKLVTKIDASSFKKLDIRGLFDQREGVTYFRFQLLHTGDKTPGAYIIDAEDETPLLAMVGDITAVYDVAIDQLILIYGTQPMLTVTQGKTEIELNLSPEPAPTAPSAAPLIVNIDLPAIFARHHDERTVTRRSDGSFDWKGVSGPSHVAAIIDSRQSATPVDRLTEEMQDKVAHKFTIDTMNADDEVTYHVHPLPSIELLNSQLKVTQIAFKPEAGAKERATVIDRIFARARASVGFRYALRHKDARLKAQQMFGPANWEAMEKADPLTSEKLRRLIRLPAPAVPIQR
jgi:hypothetical protein